MVSAPTLNSTSKAVFASLTQHVLRAIGFAAVVILAAMFIKPELAEKFKALSPFATIERAPDVDAPAPPSLALLMATPKQLEQAQNDEMVTPDAIATVSDEKNFIGDQRQQQWVTNWLAKRYRVASDASNMLVSAAYLTAKDVKIDPLLILSVMAIESGLNPFAESPVGAQGLMQVMSKIHRDKFEEMGGVKAALNPVANIRVGALILKDYVTRGGSLEAGLKLYVGAGAFENDGGYGSRVIAEYRRLKDVATGKNVPTMNTVQTIPSSNKPSNTADDSKFETPVETKIMPVEQKAVDIVATL
ncbi:MAG: lytic transglycosylase domain-containing protein [Burkholderiaceae bacterium]|nr:lytic transglycosylase domain-containing protein [Burkholderiaceae bacterium]